MVLGDSWRIGTAVSDSPMKTSLQMRSALESEVQLRICNKEACELRSELRNDQAILLIHFGPLGRHGFSAPPT